METIGPLSYKWFVNRQIIHELPGDIDTSLLDKTSVVSSSIKCIRNGAPHKDLQKKRNKAQLCVQKFLHNALGDFFQISQEKNKWLQEEMHKNMILSNTIVIPLTR